MLHKFIKSLVRKYLTPDFFVEGVSCVTVQMLRKMNVSVLLLDVDSTISVKNSPVVNKEIRRWVSVHAENGFRVALVSNNFDYRVSQVARILRVPYLSFALKPCTFRVKNYLKREGFELSSSVVVGDQIFSDILMANFLGLKSILVKPLYSNESFIMRFKRCLESYVKKYYPESFMK